MQSYIVVETGNIFDRCSIFGPELRSVQTDVPCHQMERTDICARDALCPDTYCLQCKPFQRTVFCQFSACRWKQLYLEPVRCWIGPIPIRHRLEPYWFVLKNTIIIAKILIFLLTQICRTLVGNHFDHKLIILMASTSSNINGFTTSVVSSFHCIWRHGLVDRGGNPRDTHFVLYTRNQVECTQKFRGLFSLEVF